MVWVNSFPMSVVAAQHGDLGFVVVLAVFSVALVLVTRQLLSDLL